MRSDPVAPISKTAILAARARFVLDGTDAQHWAVDNGFPPKLVHAILRGERRCLRGISHQIALALDLFTSAASEEPAKDTSSPAGHTLAGAGAIGNFDRTGILQLVGEPAR